MLQYKTHTLNNGLKLIVHTDKSVQTAVLNLIYNVGSKDENPDKTGFAHLFEHLMFGGSKNCPDFDSILQDAGGENNAFTSTDVTNYYITIPSANIETAFWVESDRMAYLNLDEKSLEVQRKVVIEEFKQRYLNQPYGDVWLKLRPLVYQNHGYSWATIGKNIEHIEEASLQDVSDFHTKYYTPTNATLVIGGNIEFDNALELTEKYFGTIPSGKSVERTNPKIEFGTGYKTLTIKGKVPQKAIYLAFTMPERKHKDYYTFDLLSDVLGRGKSSRLYKKLVIENEWMNNIGASLTSSFLEGLFIISGRINEDISFEMIENEIFKVIDVLITNGLEDAELVKVKNQAEASIEFGRIEVLERCISLAYADLIDTPEMVNEELHQLEKVSESDLLKIAQSFLTKENCCVLYYDKLIEDE